MSRKLVAGNWKMNGGASTLAGLNDLAAAYQEAPIDIAVCPPAPFLAHADHIVSGSAIEIGAQDCHTAASGAHTGDVAAGMLAELGCAYVIVGHSERRADHGETNATVAAKAQAVLDADMRPIICIGESLDQRKAGQTLEVVAEQLAQSVPDTEAVHQLVVAYEPIWAIGTGEVATIEQIAEVHGELRAQLVDRFGEEGVGVPLLYGGSVKAGNAADIFDVAHVDGALVGGASLKPDDFMPIVNAMLARV
ncbi:MAG: triose-phosphate isomerase [Rhodobacteraceae bacterium]|nr:triose-phosphate isomerase [Paracoccaceae bacterium]